MAMIPTSFEAVADRIQVGDVLAFGGHGLLSRIIRRATGGPVSHAATIIALDPKPIALMESTVRIEVHPTYGVGLAPAGDIVAHYAGEVWLLPLSEAVRAGRFDERQFVAFLRSKVGGAFDVRGGLRVIIDEFLDQLRKRGVVDMTARLESFFCSELVADGLRAAGTAPGVKPEWVSPRDLCEWNVYTDDYFHLRGDRLEIPGYDTVEPHDSERLADDFRRATSEIFESL
jgi:hypothetical protein